MNITDEQYVGAGRAMSKFILIFVLLVGTAHAQDEQAVNELREHKVVLAVLGEFASEMNTAGFLEACGKPGLAESVKPAQADIMGHSVAQTRKAELADDWKSTERQRTRIWQRAVRTADIYQSGVTQGVKIVLGALVDGKSVCDHLEDVADELLTGE